MTEERSGADLRHDAAVPQPSSTPAQAQVSWDSPGCETRRNPDPSLNPDRQRNRGISLTPQTRDRIASQLRTMYDSVANQPVPDRFAELIARLDTSDREG